MNCTEQRLIHECSVSSENVAHYTYVFVRMCWKVVKVLNDAPKKITSEKVRFHADIMNVILFIHHLLSLSFTIVIATMVSLPRPSSQSRSSTKRKSAIGSHNYTQYHNHTVCFPLLRIFFTISFVHTLVKPQTLKHYFLISCIISLNLTLAHNTQTTIRAHLFCVFFFYFFTLSFSLESLMLLLIKTLCTLFYFYTF